MYNQCGTKIQIHHGVGPNVNFVLGKCEDCWNELFSKIVIRQFSKPHNFLERQYFGKIKRGREQNMERSKCKTKCGKCQVFRNMSHFPKRPCLLLSKIQYFLSCSTFILIIISAFKGTFLLLIALTPLTLLGLASTNSKSVGANGGPRSQVCAR